MAIVHKHGKGTEVYLNGWNMTQILNSADWDHSVDTADTTTFGDNDMTYIPGLRTGTVNLSGLWSDDGSGGGSTAHLDGVFDDVLGSSTDVKLVVGLGGSTYADPAIIATLQETQRAASSPVSGAVTTNVVGTINGRTALGKWIAPMVARSSNTAETTGTTVGLNGSTTAETGYVMQLHVIAGTTSGDATAELATTVQDSSDSSTWVDLPTQFTDVSGVLASIVPYSEQIIVHTQTCKDFVHVQHIQDSTTLTWGIAMARIPISTQN